MEYVIVGLLVAAIIAIASIIGYYQNKVAQVNEKIATLQSQKKASDNDIEKYRDDAEDYVQPRRNRDAIADSLDKLR